MRGVEVTGIGQAILGVAIVLIIASFPLRAWMFHKLQDDVSVRDLFDGRSMIGSDFLAFGLVRKWRTLSIAARGPVLAFVVAQLSGMLLLLLVCLRTLI
jgi:hypothetical protein